MNQLPQLPACLECLTEEGLERQTREGAPLCVKCADEYYVACAECRGLIPREDAASSDGLPFCLECLARLADPDAEPLDEEQIETLAREFVELHAQLKPLNDRLDEIKEKLKRVASGRPREGNAVLIGNGDAAVKCGYSTRVSYDADRLLALENDVGADLIETLFERKTSFSANKESLAAFLADKDPRYASARTAIEDATETKEIQSLGPAVTRRKSRREKA
jgi:hypothetical protein